MSKKRLDQLLQELYPEWSRSKLQALIEKGHVEIFNSDWKVESRPGAKIDSDRFSLKNIRVKQDEEFAYVSRGALKLKKAMETFRIPIQNRIALDVGLSTGGFSDYLLQNRILRILGIDVGTRQLHPSLAHDDRLVSYDKINARHPLPESILAPFFKDSANSCFDLIVVDVSFISLSLIIPNLRSLLAANGDMVTLLKPQFELTKSDLNKKGVVKTEEGLHKAKKKIIEVLRQNTLEVVDTIDSPIEGENGNKEFLIWSRP